MRRRLRCARRAAYTRLLIDAIPLPEIDPGWLNRNPADATASKGGASSYHG